MHSETQRQHKYALANSPGIDVFSNFGFKLDIQMELERSGEKKVNEITGKQR